MDCFESNNKKKRKKKQESDCVEDVCDELACQILLFLVIGVSAVGSVAWVVGAGVGLHIATSRAENACKYDLQAFLLISSIEYLVAVAAVLCVTFAPILCCKDWLDSRAHYYMVGVWTLLGCAVVGIGNAGVGTVLLILTGTDCNNTVRGYTTASVAVYYMTTLFISFLVWCMGHDMSHAAWCHPCISQDEYDELSDDDDEESSLYSDYYYSDDDSSAHRGKSKGKSKGESVLKAGAMAWKAMNKKGKGKARSSDRDSTDSEDDDTSDVNPKSHAKSKSKSTPKPKPKPKSKSTPKSKGKSTKTTSKSKPKPKSKSKPKPKSKSKSKSKK